MACSKPEAFPSLRATLTLSLPIRKQLDIAAQTDSNSCMEMRQRMMSSRISSLTSRVSVNPSTLFLASCNTITASAHHHYPAIVARDTACVGARLFFPSPYSLYPSVLSIHSSCCAHKPTLCCILHLHHILHIVVVIISTTRYTTTSALMFPPPLFPPFVKLWAAIFDDFHIKTLHPHVVGIKLLKSALFIGNPCRARRR